MNTDRLYYSDVMLREFEAVVLECTENKNGYRIALDRTAFYPEGGGQPGDTGILETEDGTIIRVEDTHEKDGCVWHYTNQVIEAGTHVKGVIDWEERFDNMQNHSGEHIVSGLLHEKFGYNNVGFHMGSESITIDLDGMVTWEELREIEKKANEAVWADSRVIIDVCDQEEIKTRTYRSKKELTGDVRLVNFPGADICACCGTHVLTTGQIGLIRILSLQKFKGGVRIEMLCGRKACAYMDTLFEQNKKISNLLSAKPLKTAEAVEKLKSAAEASAFRMEKMERESFQKAAAALTGKGNVLLFAEELDPNGVRRLADEVMNACGGLCAVFSGNEEQGYAYAVGEKDGDLKALVKELNGVLRGHGGGRPYFAQGSVQAGKEEIREFFRQRFELTESVF